MPNPSSDDTRCLPAHPAHFAGEAVQALLAMNEHESNEE